METKTPLPMDSFAPATTTALYKFNGPSALRAVEGRCTSKYNRFVTFHDKIQEIRRFLPSCRFRG